MTRTIKLAGGVEAQIGNPERGEFPPNLGGAVQYSLAKVLVWAMESLGEGLGALGGSALVSFLEHIEPELVTYYSPLIDELLDLPDVPEFFKAFLEAVKSPEHEAGAAVLNSVLGSATGAVTGSLLGTLLAPLTYGLNQKVRPARTAPSDTFAMAWRGLLDDPTVQDWLKDQGWPDPAIAAFPEIIRPRTGIGDLVAWAWRVHQDPEVVREELKKRGYLDADIDKGMELAKYIPPIPDLVSMAVREAWHDDVAARYGYDEGYPKEFEEWALKRGMSEEWSRRYWRAHWRMPGLVTAQEMLWRTSMTKDDYKTLLKIADYPATFRDWMAEVAYRPYTRVDVRRMHAVGVIDDAGLLRAYKDIGFDDEKARAMADFTIAYNRATDDEFTKTEILSGFREGMLSFDVAVQLLVDIGKSRDYAMYVLALEEYKRIKALVAERVRYVRTLYVAGELDRTGASMRLAELNLEPDRIDRYIEEWDIARTAKIAKPPLARIEEWYKEDVIDETTARRELAKRRYQDYAINWYIRDWDTQVVELARKEEERAQKERERIAKAKFRTERQVLIAALNAEIATLKLAIAELKVIEHDTERAEEYGQIKAEIAKLYMAYWKAETDEEREQIMARINDLIEALGLQDTLIVQINRDILIAKRDIAAKQLEKTQIPIAPP